MYYFNLFKTIFMILGAITIFGCLYLILSTFISTDKKKPFKLSIGVKFHLWATLLFFVPVFICYYNNTNFNNMIRLSLSFCFIICHLLIYLDRDRNSYKIND